MSMKLIVLMSLIMSFHSYAQTYYEDGLYAEEEAYAQDSQNQDPYAMGELPSEDRAFNREPGGEYSELAPEEQEYDWEMEEGYYDPELEYDPYGTEEAY